MTMDIEKIREDFPVLKRMFRGKPIIYLDNACVSLRPRQVINAMDKYYEQYPACAGRSIHKLGNEVTEKYEKSREEIAKFISAKEREIIFTRNTTEGINLLVNSLKLEEGDVVLGTDKEHNSNLLPWQFLSKRKGVRRDIVHSNKDGTFNMEDFENKVKNAKVVSMVHTSNLDSYTIPAKEIVKKAHKAGALVILDCAQSVPHKEINVKELDADFIAFSGHKMLGPSIGVLYGKYHLLEELEPFLVGGDTVKNTTYESCELEEPPARFEAGLQNYAGAMGLAEAVRYLKAIGMMDVEKHEKELSGFIIDGLSSLGIDVIGPKERGGVISFNINGINHHDAAIMLDELANIAVRSGQFCVHSWFNANKIEGAIRASLYIYNTKEEAEVLINTIKDITKLR